LIQPPESSMKAEKKVFANQIQEGQALEDLFMVKDMSRAETRAGKPYLIMTLMDRSGEIAGRLWENADALIGVCEQGSMLRITGQAQAYRGSLQIKIDSVHPVDRQELDETLFLQTTSKNIAAMVAAINSLTARVKEPFCRKLLLKLFHDARFLADFQKAPAAKTMHHAYLGGLLEHTLAVSQLAEMLAGFYQGLDRDLLVTGALLHDIGKTQELSYDTFPFDYTDKGRLVGHLVLGVEMIQEVISTIKNFPQDLATRLQHLVLSHHGRYEFGSPCLPMLSEAFVLNFLDDMDAKLNFLGRLEEQAPEPGYQWTDFQRTLERFLYIKGRPSRETEADMGVQQEDGEISPQQHNSKQQHLF
jgi:3'-5' exoribonuclease